VARSPSRMLQLVVDPDSLRRLRPLPEVTEDWVKVRRSQGANQLSGRREGARGEDRVSEGVDAEFMEH